MQNTCVCFGYRRICGACNNSSAYRCYSFIGERLSFSCFHNGIFFLLNFRFFTLYFLNLELSRIRCVPYLFCRTSGRGGRGVEVFVEVDEDKKTVIAFPPEIWDYPKDNYMSKKKITEVENMIVSYFADRGYTVVFLTEEDDGEASD